MVARYARIRSSIVGLGFAGMARDCHRVARIARRRRRQHPGKSAMIARQYGLSMPEVSRFFGIVIRMHYREHGPPHFHAIYGEHEVQIAIETLQILQGRLPPRALGLTIEWAGLHRGELMQDWDLAAAQQRLRMIEPLG